MLTDDRGKDRLTANNPYVVHISAKGKRMKPDDLAKSGTEDGHQMALFCWVHQHVATTPELNLLFAIPNGGARNPATAAKLKATGTKKGVSDMMLPVARHGKHGLFLELKKLKDGRESSDQIAWGAAVRGEGYAYCCCKGWRAAAHALIQWLGMPADSLESA